MKLDRRNFIGSSAAIAAALSAPTVMASGKPRVVVVGGGISGLSAGSLLREKGYDVTIFEASNRLGGKILTTELSGIAIDAGPDAFLVREPEMKELCVSLGLADDLVAPQPRTAKIWVDGAMHSLPKNQFLGIPREVVNDMSPKLREIVGYNSWNLLGKVDNSLLLFV